MIGYLAVLFQRNDVADGEAVSHKIAGALVVENVVEVFKDSAGIIVRVHLTGIDGFIVGRVRRRGQTAEVGKTQLHRRIPAQLVDRHRIGGTVQKTLLHIAGRDMALDRIPIRSCDAEHSVVLDDVLGFKDHFLGVVGIEHINRDVMLQQLHRPILGKWEHIAIQIPIAAHIVHRQRGVRHRDGLFQLREHIICRIGGNSDCAGDLFAVQGRRNLRLLQVLQNFHICKCHLGWCHALNGKYLRSDSPGNRCNRRIFNGAAVNNTAIQQLFAFLVVERIVPTAVCMLHMEIYRAIHKIKRFVCLCGAHFFTIDAALLANLRKVPVNVRNQLGSRLVDGFQTGAKLFQLLAL